ncbi:hypothetical protein KIN20_034353 [Parelaphostrongylus tenuis]|uniref:Uncharacterized protein n=1 Tax=Parelaphostrongylus tenuis TaxID=148309 RepID=A0AAD5R9H4_PARTN|nr:hypothetical protein KIN20_034353 [Parelaphostrongylus tenuis]
MISLEEREKSWYEIRDPSEGWARTLATDQTDNRQRGQTGLWNTPSTCSIRISYIFSHINEYDFAKCLWQLKVGVAVNSVQFVVATVEVFLNFLSAILCMKRTCTSCI